MLPTRNGSVRLFRFAGIDVWLHWSWAVIALWAIQSRQGLYTSITWNVIEYLALFGIVLMHEFGHALACRQTGGQASQIVLWPLGGVAYVSPPFRAGAQLWSIFAGPLVNIILVPVLMFLPQVMITSGLAPSSTDFWLCYEMIQRINIGLLVFNMLPVYPLDGGQILRSLLWFLIGPRKSLLAATSLGLAGAAALIILAVTSGSIWIGIIAAFLGITCWRAFQAARQGAG